MPVPVSTASRKNRLTSLNEDNGAGLRIHTVISGADIPTNLNGYIDVYTMAPEDGVLHSVEFSNEDSLAANDTNYMGFFLTNLGQNGLAATEMLANSPENTTKLNGGYPLIANSRRILKLVSITELLKVEAGDRLRFRMGATGNIPKALKAPVILIRFNP